MWIYKDKEITDLPDDCVGFVYQITNTTNGRMYIGKKLAKFKKAWEEEVAESSAADPLFAEVHKSYSDFRKKYAIWGDRAYLK